MPRQRFDVRQAVPRLRPRAKARRADVDGIGAGINRREATFQILRGGQKFCCCQGCSNKDRRAEISKRCSTV